ncbi:sensor domain-containing phosphodiesterase [Polymorphobacter sp.]|uniref:sensor domain-containing phosphodiesterase n=1 Tax=Polymorphobacter sp. TaxID=1909290 RepID=UPI003F6F16B9
MSHFSAPSIDDGGLSRLVIGAGDGIIENYLRAVRTHLGLQVAYVSEIIGNDSVFRHVDAPGLEALIKPGDMRSLDDVYCRHIVEGRLPELIPDTSAEPLAVSMPITAAIPIGAHVSVPLRLADGTLFGMFCCLGPQADATLNPRDLAMMRAFADLAAFEIDKQKLAGAEVATIRTTIEQILAGDGLDMVYQPIWQIGATQAGPHHPIGFEALARFHLEPYRSPDAWFADARRAGLSLELELRAIEHALGALTRLPNDIYVTVNASPQTASDPALAGVLAGFDLKRIILEITEQKGVEDFLVLHAALAEMRAAGLRIAIDDAGSGYSGLQQILQLRPDIIKLDRFFVTGIERDPSRRALAAALGVFAEQVGSVMIAEGVEAESELATLRALGFRTIQGYLLGKPQSLAEALTLIA